MADHIQTTVECDELRNTAMSSQKQLESTAAKLANTETKLATAERQLVNLARWKTAHANYKSKLRELDQTHQLQLSKIRKQTLQKMKRADKNSRTITTELEKELATQQRKHNHEMERTRTLHSQHLSDFELSQDGTGEINQIKRTESRELLLRLVKAREARHAAQRNTTRKSLSIQELRQKLRDKNLALTQKEKEYRGMDTKIQQQGEELEALRQQLLASQAEKVTMGKLLAQVPTLHKIRDHKNMTWPVEYKAYIMHLLTNRMDPSVVHSTLAANTKFYLPWVHKADVASRVAVAAAMSAAAAASAAIVQTDDIIYAAEQDDVSTDDENEHDDEDGYHTADEDGYSTASETEDGHMDTCECAACHAVLDKYFFSRRQLRMKYASRCKDCVENKKPPDLRPREAALLLQHNLFRAQRKRARKLTTDSHVPSLSTIHTFRRMLQPLAETLAAWEAVISGKCGGWLLGHDGSEIDQINTITVNAQIRLAPENSPKQSTDEYKIITLRGCYFTTGKTSALECEGIEKCFENGRNLLRMWIATFEEMFPGEEHNIPDPEKFHLGMCDAVISDTANQAKTLSRLVLERIQEEKKKELIESGEWDMLDEEEKEKKLYAEVLQCLHHMRNLVIKKGADAEVQLMKVELAPALEEVSSRERLEVNLDSLLRSIAKEFGTLMDAYAKGKGIKEFVPWMKKQFDKSVLLFGIRSVGSRQDYSVEAAFIEYHNRPYYVRFLKLAQYEDPNILEDSIYVRLTAVVYVAALRARAIIFDKISQRLRFLCNSNELSDDFTHLSLAPFLDQLETFLLAVKEDGSILIDKDLVVFENESGLDAAERSAVVALEEYEQHLLTKPYNRMDGTGIKKYRTVIRAELYDPDVNSTNYQATTKTIVFLQAWATGMLNGLRENMGDYLTSQQGKYAWGTTSEEMKLLAKGKERTNNMCETMFAIFDYLYNKHPNFLVSTVAGVTIAKKNKVFEDGGAWSRLTDKMQQALMRMITTKYKEIMEANTKAQELQLEHNTEKRKFKRTAALATAEDKYTKAQKLFKQGLTSLDELTELCSNDQGEICEQSNMVGKQRDALKHNI